MLIESVDWVWNFSHEKDFHNNIKELMKNLVKKANFCFYLTLHSLILKYWTGYAFLFLCYIYKSSLFSFINI